VVRIKLCVLVLYSDQNPDRERNIPVRLRFWFGVTVLAIDFTAYNRSYIRSHSCRTSLNAVYLLQHPMHTILSNTNHLAPPCAIRLSCATNSWLYKKAVDSGMILLAFCRHMDPCDCYTLVIVFPQSFFHPD
jgi:hypothetical protein